MRKYKSPIILLLSFGLGFYLVSTPIKKVEQISADPGVKTIQLCFYGNKQTPQNLEDKAWLRMFLTGDKVTGEFRNLPAKTDIKVGTFFGSVGKVNPYMMARTADVWWDATAEGVRATEQLRIIFGEGTANAYFGMMVDRGDGVSIYKDMNKLFSTISMTDVACDDPRLVQ